MPARSLNFNGSVMLASFLLGLLGSFGHCVGMCSAVVVLLGRQSSFQGNHLAWTFAHLGRISTYALLDLAAGLLGPVQIRSNWMTALTVGLAVAALAGCQDRGNERGTTTANTTVDIDWDKVQEAYRTAAGPQDFENKINEIYEGDELISVAVQDKDEKTQGVTGFFDRNSNGQAEEPEKVFVISRGVVDQNRPSTRSRATVPMPGIITRRCGTSPAA